MMPTTEHCDPASGRQDFVARLKVRAVASGDDDSCRVPHTFGCLGNFGRSGFIWSQGWALDVKKSIVGLKRVGSSRLPAVINMNCGKPDVLPKTLPPQVGQNPRLKVLPLSERLS